MKDALIVYKPVDIGEGRTLTLAAEVNVQPTYKLISFGMSIKNPTDNESKQVLGDTIAKGRAQKNPVFVMTTTGQAVSRSFVDKVAAVLQEEIGSKVRNYVPFSDKKKAGNKTQPRETKVGVS